MFERNTQNAHMQISAFNYNFLLVFRLKGDVASALNDLETALSKSQGRGKAARQAFVQRGLINRRNGNDQQAKNDFQKAADLGKCHESDENLYRS